MNVQTVAVFGPVVILFTAITTSGVTLYGQFGAKVFKTTMAVREKVSWKDAAELCFLRLNGHGRLLVRAQYDPFEANLMHIRYILQQQNWSTSDHLWTGFMAKSNGTFQRSGKLGSCEDISQDLIDNFPQPPLGIEVCLLLNMTGATPENLLVLRPCNEGHNYLCRYDTQSDPEIQEVTSYNATTIDTSSFSHDPDILFKSENNIHGCETKLHNQMYGFAAVFFAFNLTCKLFLSREYNYPIQIVLLPDTTASSLVRTKGLQVHIVESQGIEVTHPLYDDCVDIKNATTSSCHLPSLTSEPSVVKTTETLTSVSQRQTTSNNLNSDSTHQSHRITDNNIEKTTRIGFNQPYGNEETTGMHIDTSDYLQETTGSDLVTTFASQELTTLRFDTTQQKHMTTEENINTTNWIQKASSLNLEVTTESRTAEDSNCFENCNNNCLSQGRNEYKWVDMKLDRKQLSSYKRRLRSASDDRFSVVMIGWSGAFVLIMAVLIIIIPDVRNVITQLRNLSTTQNTLKITNKSGGISDIP